MINANELRIGNWVNFHFQTTIFNGQILSIERTTVSVQNDKYLEGYSFHNISPIPLTPEILEKCGILPTEPKGWFIIIPGWGKQSMLFFWPDNDCLHYVDGAQSPDIRYIHQLQNLYFALTGTELNINLCK